MPPGVDRGSAYRTVTAVVVRATCVVSSAGGQRLTETEPDNPPADQPERGGSFTTLTKKSSIWRTTEMNRSKSTGLVT